MKSLSGPMAPTPPKDGVKGPTMEGFELRLAGLADPTCVLFRL
ncbi:hypothetical protein [Caulobacter sp. 602-1]|nr:hypothetical protein [Caulobacter sp. 602-1]